MRDLCEIKGFGDTPIRHALLASDFDLLSGHIAGVLHIVTDLFGDAGRNIGQFRCPGNHLRPAHLRTLEQLGQCHVLAMVGFQHMERAGNFGLLGGQSSPAIGPH